MVTSASNTVKVAFANNPTGAKLGGTLSVKASQGVATFSNLTINKVGSGYTLQLTSSGLSSAVTNPINVTKTAAASSLSARAARPRRIRLLAPLVLDSPDLLDGLPLKKRSHGRRCHYGIACSTILRQGLLTLHRMTGVSTSFSGPSLLGTAGREPSHWRSWEPIDAAARCHPRTAPGPGPRRRRGGAGPVAGALSQLPAAHGPHADQPAAAGPARCLRPGPGDVPQGPSRVRPVPRPDRARAGRLAAADPGPDAWPTRPSSTGPGGGHQRAKSRWT